MADCSVGNGETSTGAVVKDDLMSVLLGGTAEGVVVSSGGRMEVFAGGVANNTVLSGGSLTLSGGTANDTVLRGGSSYVSDGGAQLIEFFSGGLTVLDGGMANGGVLHEGSIVVSNGGTAAEIVENGGLLHVSKGGSVNSATVNGGRLSISDGGTLNGASINRGGRLTVSSGGTAVEIEENGGYIEVADGAEVSFTEHTVSGLNLYDLATIHSKTKAVEAVIGNGGCLYISGGTADSVVVSGGGLLCVCSDGRLGGNVTIENDAFVSAFAGAVLDFGSQLVFSEDEDSARITSRAAISGSLTIEEGAILSGRATFARNADVRIDGTVVFDITNGTTDPLFTGFSIIAGTPAFSLITEEKAGIYLLADGVSSFNSPVKFGDTVLTADGTAVQIGNFEYALGIAGSTLYLKIADRTLPPDDGPEKAPWNNNLLDRSRGGLSQNFDDFVMTPLGYGFKEILLDRIDSVKHNAGNGETYNNFVGYGDEFDYAKINLAKNAKLSFDIDATDAVKFTLYKLVRKTGRNNKVTYSLKQIQATSLKRGETKKTSKQILIEAGEYYISVQSTNANKTDAAAFYNVALAENGAAPSKFYLDCDDGGNNWLYDKGLGGWNDTVLDSVAFAFDSKTAIQVDDDVLGHKDGEKAYANFVGFGDAMDVRKIELAHAAKLSFSVEHTGGKAKFILYRINEKGRMVAVIPGKTFKSGGSTAEKVLEKGVYYIAVQSAGAKNGDEVYYDVNVDGTFYNDGDAGTNDYLWTRSDGWNEAVVNSTAKALAAEAFQVDADVLNVKRGGTVYTNFVGTGDTGDVVKIQAAAGMTVCFNVEATDAVSFVIYERVFKNNRYSQKVLQTTNLTAKNGFRNDAVMYTFKNDGDFYVGVMSANAKKGSEAYYNVEIASVVNSSAASLDAPVSAGLAMEEASDSLDLAGELSPVQYAAGTPADVSLSSGLKAIQDDNGFGLELARLA